MNIALEQTEEYVNGAVKNRLERCVLGGQASKVRVNIKVNVWWGMTCHDLQILTLTFPHSILRDAAYSNCRSTWQQNNHPHKCYSTKPSMPTSSPVTTIINVAKKYSNPKGLFDCKNKIPTHPFRGKKKVRSHSLYLMPHWLVHLNKHRNTRPRQCIGKRWQSVESSTRAHVPQIIPSVSDPPNIITEVIPALVNTQRALRRDRIHCRCSTLVDSHCSWTSWLKCHSL